MQVLPIRFSLFFCVIFILSLRTSAQSYSLSVRASEGEAAFWQQATWQPNQKNFKDSISVLKDVDSLLHRLQTNGYWAASVDSLVWNKKKCDATFFVGKAYTWSHLDNGNIETAALESIGFKTTFYQKTNISPQRIAALKDKLVAWAENRGYPFCTVWIEVQTDTPQLGQVSGKIFWKKGDLFLFDKAIIEGKARISRSFLEQYLSIQPNTVYNEAVIKKIRSRLSELSFLEESQPFSIDFSQAPRNSKARPHFFLKRKRASKFDALIGFLPSSQPDKPLLVTGNAEIEFHNLFGGGQEFRFQWTQARPESPEVKIEAKLPYLFKFPLGADGSFELYKRDTSYLDTRGELGISYKIKGSDYLKVFWNTFNTALLTIDTLSIKATRRLPSVLDVNTSGGGIEYHSENLDYRFAPHRGYSYTLRGSVGFKKVLENTQIINLYDAGSSNKFDYTRLYDSLRNQSAQYRLQLKGDYYLPFGERNVVRLGTAGGALFSTSALYRNEQFRIGGARLLRGFDEESLFASLYGMATLEYRFLLSQNSYLFAFADKAYLENTTATTRFFDRPLGIGGGLSLETKAGIFALTIAFGQQQEQPIDFNAAKVHFGYVSVF